MDLIDARCTHFINVIDVADVVSMLDVSMHLVDAGCILWMYLLDVIDANDKVMLL